MTGKVETMSIAFFKTMKLKTAALLFPALLLLPFPLSNPLPTIEKPAAGQAEYNEFLQTESDALLPLFDSMPPVAVYLTAQPILKSGSSVETGVAYTRCDSSEQPVIYIKKDFYEKTNRKQLVNILKHELTHAWLCRQNLMSGHDELFRRKFTAVGGFGN